MATRPLLVVSFLLTGCATLDAEPEELVDNPYYRAFGSEGWRVEIGDDIALRLGYHFFDGNIMAIYRYPAVIARHHGEVRRWRSGGHRGILVETRPGPCRTAGGYVLPDHVRVVHFQGEWQGCGEPWSGDKPS